MQRTFISLFFSTLPIATLGCLVPLTAKAQVTPDGTTATTVNQDGNNFTIEQGDRAGDNLFHSFDEFSVPTLGSAVFNNAGDINNIFSRVTGSSISNIDGLLSAKGAANLYLINPNGIIFGENASLNLGGSFFASTADSLLFEGDKEFSAVNPQAAPLLEVNIPIGLSFRDNPGDITNQGNLAVKQDFTLSGGNLDLHRQLQAGGDLTLQATDTVEIRDDAENPFVAAANGQLLVQGNQNVDIFALDHPNSGFFSGGDLVLRSANAVSGDARYWSQGNFKIEQLDENLGNFISLFDPIVFANGDISFASYEGVSLHILAGGSVNINSIIITGTGTIDTSINPTNTSELANITLSDDTQLTINGSTQPTVDIRAGIDWTQLGGLPGNFSVGVDISPEFFSANATSGDINIENIGIAAPDGLVFLTNQYLPNNSLSESNIQIETILTGDLFDIFSDGNSGRVIVDSRNNFTIGNAINTGSEFNNAGDITLIADNQILLNNSSIVSGTLRNGRGGNISIQSKSLFLTNNALTGSNTFGEGTGGDLNINTEQLMVEDSAIQVTTNGIGNAGRLTINATDSVLISGDFINSDGSIGPSGINVNSQAENGGDAGDLIINTSEVGRLTVSDGGQVTASTNGSGEGGNIFIDSSSIELIGSSSNSGFSSGIFASTSSSGNGGNLEIQSNSLLAQDGAQIGAETSGSGNGGNLNINARDITLQNNVNFSASSGNQGSGGNITIDTRKLLVENNSGIGSVGESEGDAGTLSIQSDSTTLQNSALSVENSQGQAGNLDITTNSLSQNQGKIIAETGLNTVIDGENVGANINLEISDTWRIENESLVSATAFGDADGGNININQGIFDTEFILLAFPPIGDNGSDISANAEQGNGGRIDITAAGVFGIDFRDNQTPLNDFTVSSEFGTSGETIINRTFEDPTSGLINLPASVGDASDQISQNPCQQGLGSQFIVTGKGGLPPTVNESFNSEKTQVGLIEPLPQPFSYDNRGEGKRQGEDIVTEAVPAMGWVFNDKGEVTLTAYSTSGDSVQRSGQKYQNTCQSRIVH